MKSRLCFRGFAMHSPAPIPPLCAILQPVFRFGAVVNGAEARCASDTARNSPWSKVSGLRSLV